ncbi:hypothetical protein B0H63DRAFT_301826 [Podospora didyma]|uniref:Uncharacterized protein n=1 Tax=Podospora didyma TaxID=330526 RepID=A0AAE0KB19_9PEZI|nr:hypothetical protein B0H63DRAFT_301826 [Podospora didyma]
MGASQSTSFGAQFVGEGLPVFRSYQPCHVFGDSSLYSVGTRLGFYLQYFAVLLSILFFRGQDVKTWFLCFLPLAAANFTVLLVSANAGDGLIVLDWAIVFGLVVWSIVFLAWSVFSRHNLRSSPGLATDTIQLQQDLARESGRMVSGQEAEWDRQYIAVLMVLGSREEEERGRRDSWRGDPVDKQDALTAALQQYVDAFLPARGSPDSADAAYLISTYYDSDRIQDTVASMMMDNRQVGIFRDTHTEALRQANIPFNQAQATTQILARMAKEELKPRDPNQPARSTWQAVKEFEEWAGTAGTLGCGLGLVLYGGYSIFMIWLLFRGIGNGAKSGCDIRIILFVAPVSVYNPGAVTALRVLACILFVVVGMPALLLGIGLFVVGINDWWSDVPQRRRRSSNNEKRDRTGFISIAYDAEQGRGAAARSSGMPRHAHSVSIPRVSRTSDILSDASLYRQPSASLATERRGSDFYFDPALKETSVSDPVLGMRGGLATGGTSVLQWARGWIPAKRKWWAPFFLGLAIVHTVVVVELTIRINKLDMRQRPMTSMGELIAFFLGLFLFVRVVARCLLAAEKRLRRRRAAGWFDERWRILAAPAERWQDQYGVGAVPGRSATGESRQRESTVLRQSRIYLQPEGKSRSSMGKFKEIMDDA